MLPNYRQYKLPCPEDDLKFLLHDMLPLRRKINIMLEGSSHWEDSNVRPLPWRIAEVDVLNFGGARLGLRYLGGGESLRPTKGFLFYCNQTIGRTRPSPWPLDFPQMPGIVGQWGQVPSGPTRFSWTRKPRRRITVALAVVAAGVFPFADLAGEVAGVDVSDAGLLAVFDDVHQIIGRRAAIAIGHFVIGMEGGDVPGHEGIDAGEEVGHAFEFVGIVAEAGDDEGDDFDPEVALLEHSDGVGDVFQDAAELAVVWGLNVFRSTL